MRKYLYYSSFQRPNSYNESQRQSQRFGKFRQRQSMSDIENGNTLNSLNSTNDLDVLCCIKLIGDNAGKFMCNKVFNKFLTMDNEGNVYYLRQMFDDSENINETKNQLNNLNIRSS